MPRHMLALPTAQPQMRRRKTIPTLPQPLTSLVGRKREVADALRLLRHKHVRLLTLTGPPGVGKTRLCIEIAYKVAGSFDDSVFFVPLAPVSDPGLVASSIAQALKIRPANRGDVLSTLREHLQDKHALLILDNFEQVIEAGSLVSDLLQGCSQLTVIVTSREPLHISGEQEFAVFPLRLPGSEYRVASAFALPGAGYSTLGTVESVALFVQRAKSVRPDFELDAGNASTIAEICTRLDGLPLAIELAAARIKTLPPRVILERLEHRLHLLVGGAHDLPARQQTLRDAVDWSFSLLSADEQVLLARMAIFVGGCSLPAIENVCNYDSSLGSDVLALATSLADKSLVMPTEAGGEVRFRMLETIREFGLENLHLRGEVEELRSQHAHYFTLLVEQCMPHISDPDQAVWLDRLAQENGNLRAVLSWSLSPDNSVNRMKGSDRQRTGHSSPRFEIGLNMATQLARFWHRQGYIDEGRTWLEASIAIAAPDPDTENAANPYARQLMKAISGAGTLAQASGDYTAARRFRNRSLTLAKGLGDEEAIGNELNGLGELNNDTGDYAQAQHYLEQSLTISRRLNQEDKIALRLTDLAFAVMGQEKYTEARDLEEESLAIRRKLGDAEGVGRSLYNLASLERRTGNRSQARTYAQEVLGIARQLGFKQGIAHALSIIGEADYFRKDYPGALVSLHESLVLFSETSRRLGEIDTLSVIARVLADSGRWRKAALLLSALATVRKQMNIVKSEYDTEEAEVIERCLQAMQSTRERERWQSAWEQGSRMTWEEAVALAIAIPVPGQAPVEIQSDSQPEQAASVNMAEVEGLTERELQIVRLIAQSKSNQEIGQMLVVTKRTVETHISNILSKLGFTSRGQIAAWAIRRGLI